MSRRDERRAWNQAVFRAANEAIVGPARATGPLTLLCECGNEACKETIELTSDEYEAVRADAACFAVIPGHQSRAEAVVEEFERFALVEKLGADRAVVERMDPRARWKE